MENLRVYKFWDIFYDILFLFVLFIANQTGVEIAPFFVLYKLSIIVYVHSTVALSSTLYLFILFSTF